MNTHSRVKTKRPSNDFLRTNYNIIPTNLLSKLFIKPANATLHKLSENYHYSAQSTTVGEANLI